MRFSPWGWLLGLFCWIPLAQAEPLQPDPGLRALLQEARLPGCIVLLETHSEQIRVSEESCSQKRMLPASTFKVANALIALEANVVQEKERFPWDGTPQPFPTWERELSLQEAMAVSSVPVFQQIARRVGLSRMAEGVRRLGYGNETIGTVVDRFWLDGPLTISPLEEARFMARVATGQLPFSKPAMDSLRRLIPQETIGTTRLFGKTGWAMAARPMIGWYVGWVENPDQIMAFAVSIDMKDQESAPWRKSLALAALRHAGALRDDTP
ncbi:MAG: class D beta-lactamase [Magnetococcales bacterium]|nr:class D beta-lactamase [Magnetococcales bacterium]